MIMMDQLKVNGEGFDDPRMSVANVEVMKLIEARIEDKPSK